MPNANAGTICVIGSGFMGTVIATLYARYGYDVRITDRDAESLRTFSARAKPIASSLSESEAQAAEIVSLVKADPVLESAVKGCFFVHEVIHENLAAKQDLFAQLDKLCEPQTILGTNTSSFRLGEICARVNNRERVLGVHYVTPAHVVNLVELVTADFTPPETVEWGRHFLDTIEHVGIVCTDTPGFLVNRLQYALIAEAYRIVEEKVASRDDVDKAFRLSLGPRLALWGPLLTEDLVVSKKTSAPIWDYLHETLKQENFQRPPTITNFVETGQLGAISGQGWYRFDRDYASIVMSRDAHLKSLLNWLSENSGIDELGIS